MNTALLSVLLLVTLNILSVGCGRESKPSLAGEYTDIAESEWQTILLLHPDGRAVIEQAVWAAGDWEGREVTQIPARWSRVGSRVLLQYWDRVDTLVYSDSWSAEEFGADGKGPGLRPLTPSDESVFVGRLVLWDRSFLDSLRQPIP